MMDMFYILHETGLAILKVGIYWNVFKIHTDRFVKGIFLTSCSLQILSLILWLMRNLSDNLYIMYGEIYHWHISSFANFLLLFGLLLLIGVDSEPEQVCPEIKGKSRSIGLSLFLFFISFGIYFPFWLYRTVRDLKESFRDEVRYSPGKAVGFLFIPLFNIYWILYIAFSLPVTLRRIEKKYFGRHVGFHFHPYIIPLLILSYAVFGAIWIQIIPIRIFSSRPCEFLKMAIYHRGFIIVFWLTIQAKLNAFLDSKTIEHTQ